jgi:TonB C terminal
MSPAAPQKPRPKLFKWKTGYESDEIAMGIALAVALHAIPIALIFIKAAFPSVLDSTEEPVAKPVIAATLLKLGKPVDPKKLPDRMVPQARTAPQHEAVASRDDPKKHDPDAGAPPPPNTQASDIQRLISKSDPFAEDGGKSRPEQGFAEGVEGGTETDPSKVHAGDMYAAKLAQFFHDRWTVPSVISQGEANRLCVTYQVNISPRMQVWHLKNDPVRKSGNELFDDSAKEMLQNLLDRATALPEPPPEVADSYRGRTVAITLAGAANGDSSRCK